MLMLLIGAAIASAQTSNGTVIGAVTDEPGRASVGATLTMTSKVVRTTTTNQEGTYRVESVLPGIYDISATSPGFQTTLSIAHRAPSSGRIQPS